MGASRHSNIKTRGSVVILVAFLISIMALLAASIMGYALSERRGNERNRLNLRAQNVAENISLYAAEQLTAKLYRLGTAPVGHFPYTGNSTSTVRMPPDSVLLSEYNINSTGMQVRAAIETTTPYALVNDTTSPNNGLQVATAKVPIIAKGTATLATLGTFTSYVEQNMELALTPLFQFGMFYNMDLELYPSQAFTVTGPVHSNGRILAHPDGSSTQTILFTDRVTTADHLIADPSFKAKPRGASGGFNVPTPANGDVTFTHTNGTTRVSLKNASSLWRDCRWLTVDNPPTASELSQFKTWATTTYNGNLRTSIHGVTKLVLPGIGNYKETDDPGTAEDDRNNGRQIIESPDHKRFNGSSFTWTTDSPTLKEIKISWRAGLYIMVNPDDTPRQGKLPNGLVVTLVARSYRCWLNIINSDGSHTVNEVVLPGQPSYGQAAGPDAMIDTSDDVMYRNDLPNMMTNLTAVGSNQVLRIPQQKHGTGINSVINNGSGYAIGANALAVAGTGTVLPGDTVTIGTYRYLITYTHPVIANRVTLASAAGLRTAVSNGAAVTIDVSNVTLGTGSSYTLSGVHAINATTLTLAVGGTGSILPGNTIVIGGNKYLVTAATTAVPHAVLYIAAPGLRAAAASGVAVALDPLTDTLGTATVHRINNSGGFPVGATGLVIDTGTGTILPGNTLVIGPVVEPDLGSNRYLVTSAATASPHSAVTISPGLRAAVLDNAEVAIDPYDYTGYRTTGNGGAGAVFPVDGFTTPYAAEAYFYDLRRANGNGAMGPVGNATDFGRGTTTFTPRPIAKIDFDMGRLKNMVARVMSAATSSSGYKLNLPVSAGTDWDRCIYNSAATMTAFGLGIYDGGTATYTATASFPDAANQTRSDPFQLYYTPAYLAPSTPALLPADRRTLAVPAADLAAAWYDGVAIYIHSLDAEQRSQTSGVNNRIDSGVRLWNGRGPIASLTTATKTGCTIATNDPVYIIGHYNADGIINSTTTAVGNGGYSAKYADSASEYLCAVMGDAITIVAQPIFAQSGSAGSYTYSQTNGWCDALSALPVAASSANWRTAAAGNDDGVYGATAIKPGLLPNNNIPSTLSSATATNIKLPAATTEISTALVVGIVPSNHGPTGLTDRAPNSGANNVNSGGANNFPRLLDDWTGDSLYIRGSMVALFESRIAMEPFTHSRCYRAPSRFWGLHYNFSQANHDVPLEPVVLNSTRLGFHRLTAAQYATRKAYIEGLSAIP